MEGQGMSEKIRPLIIVAGLGRCGSSLLMQMLAAAGLPHIGSFPDYEDELVNPPKVTAATLQALPECAFKLLNPQWAPKALIGVHAVAIWLDRDRIEQAASQIKLGRFAKTREIHARASRRDIRAMAARLDKDRRRAIDALSHLPTVVVRYEGLIKAPLETCRELAEVLKSAGYPVDPAVMAACVRKSDASCAPGLAMEGRLMMEKPPKPADLGSV